MQTEDRHHHRERFGAVLPTCCAARLSAALWVLASVFTQQWRSALGGSAIRSRPPPPIPRKLSFMYRLVTDATTCYLPSANNTTKVQASNQKRISSQKLKNKWRTRKPLKNVQPPFSVFRARRHWRHRTHLAQDKRANGDGTQQRGELCK